MKFYTVNGVAHMLRISRSRVYQYIESKRFPEADATLETKPGREVMIWLGDTVKDWHFRNYGGKPIGFSTDRPKRPASVAPPAPVTYRSYNAATSALTFHEDCWCGQKRAVAMLVGPGGDRSFGLHCAHCDSFLTDATEPTEKPDAE